MALLTKMFLLLRLFLGLQFCWYTIAIDSNTESSTASDTLVESADVNTTKLLEKYLDASQVFKSYVTLMTNYYDEKLKRVKCARDLLKTDEKITRDPYKIASNAAERFKLMKRLSIIWPNILDLLHEKIKSDPRPALEQLRKGMELPEKDEVGYVGYFLSKQEDMQLSIKSAIDGQWGLTNLNTTLRADECFLIGMVCAETGRVQQAIEWLTEAVNRFDEKTSLMHVLNGAQEMLTFIALKNDNLHEALALCEKWIQKSPYLQFPPALIIGIIKEAIARKEKGKGSAHLKVDDIKASLVNSDVSSQFNAVCRGESSILEKEKAKLKCRFSTLSSPLFYLSPLKEEDMYLDPKINLYHQFLTDKEVDYLIGSVDGKMKRARISTGVDYEVRNSKTAFFGGETKHNVNQNDTEIFKNIEDRISNLVNLSLHNSEAFQLGYYESGGFYKSHCDFFTTAFEYPTGNRVATVLMYLNNVQEGGATGFPLLNFAVKPEKGAAVVWYNLLTNLDLDYRTYHGSCPVILGHKWIVTKWFRSKGQEFTYPCIPLPNQTKSNLIHV